MILDAPVVSIDGVVLASHWSMRRRIALARFSIVWGRAKHTDEAYPAQIKLDVIDTDGELATAASLVGRAVTVTRADGRVIFRGRLDDFTVERTTIIDPDANIERPVWILHLSAADKLAELATFVPPGDGTDPAGVRAYGPSYWPLALPRWRLDALMAAGANKVVSSVAWADPYAHEVAVAVVRPRPFSDGMTALDVIESVYNGAPLGYVNYDPSSNAITLGKPTTTPGIELTWDGNTLAVRVPAGGLTIPARTMGLPSGKQATTGVADAIDIVHVTGARGADEFGLDYTADATHEAHTTHYAQTLTGRREHSIASDIVYSLYSAPTTTRTFEWPFPLSSVTSEFGPRDGRHHDGIDFGNAPALAGAAITAAGDGTVIVSQFHTNGGWGNYILIDHGPDESGKVLRTLYAHMREVGVPVGTEVSKGDTIGYVGNTGNSFGAHLHLETWVDGVAIDPRIFIETYKDGVTAPGEDVPWAGWWMKLQAADMVNMLDQLNGTVTLPPVRFDFSRLTYPTGTAEAFIDTFAKNVPVYFPGSQFATIYDAATEHQIIGGTLTYDDGWTLDATLVPAIRIRDLLTWDQLVTIDTPTWDDFDPDLIFADLGNVTKGVTA